MICPRHIVRSDDDVFRLPGAAHASVTLPTRYPCVVGIQDWEDFCGRVHISLCIAYPPKRQSPGSRRSWLAGAMADWKDLS